MRSMKQAKYDAESLGHFGLAAEFYSHFTSPIRRYPDLVIHRVIREVLASGGGGLPEARHDALAARMTDIAQQSSERERVAVDAERDTERLKKAEFMLDKIGEEFDGIISGVTGFGMFVELDNTVEGLIRLSDLSDDYYHFHELHMALIGERTSRVFRIGDEVRIRVARVNMEEYTIDFEMVDMKPRSAGKTRWVDAPGSGRVPGGHNKRKKKQGAAAPAREERAGFGGGGGRSRREDRPGSGGGKSRRGKRPAAGGGNESRSKQRQEGGSTLAVVVSKPVDKRKASAPDRAAPAAKSNRRAGKLDMWGLPVSGMGLKDDGGEQEALAEMRRDKRREGGRRKGGSAPSPGTEPPRRRKRKE